MYVESSNAIDLAEFIPLDAIDRLYIEKVYYLGPDKGAARSYHLLKAALEDSGRAALARYAARGRSHLVLIRPHGRGEDTGLIMEQLKHADELRSFADVPLDPCSIEEGELELALTIIEQRLNDQFQPENYEDEVRSRMMERIQQKIDGQEVVLPPEEAPEAKIIDLMEALKASVSKAETGSKASKSAAKPAGRAAKRNDRSAVKTPAKKTASRKKR
jgi:DNA end-binding protein Ku